MTEQIDSERLDAAANFHAQAWRNPAPKGLVIPSITGPTLRRPFDVHVPERGKASNCDSPMCKRKAIMNIVDYAEDGTWQRSGYCGHCIANQVNNRIPMTLEVQRQ